VVLCPRGDATFHLSIVSIGFSGYISLKESKKFYMGKQVPVKYLSVNRQGTYIYRRVLKPSEAELLGVNVISISLKTSDLTKASPVWAEVTQQVKKRIENALKNGAKSPAEEASQWAYR